MLGILDISESAQKLKWEGTYVDPNLTSLLSSTFHIEWLLLQCRRFGLNFGTQYRSRSHGQRGPEIGLIWKWQCTPEKGSGVVLKLAQSLDFHPLRVKGFKGYNKTTPFPHVPKWKFWNDATGQWIVSTGFSILIFTLEISWRTKCLN